MPDDGDAPRLVARLVSLDPNVSNDDNVQSWIETAAPLVFPTDAQSSNALTASFGAVAFGTPVQNVTGVDLMISGSCVVASATAGVVNVGVGTSATPTVDPVTPAITCAAAISVAFSALVPSGYYFSLTHTGTISVGSPVCIATAYNGGTAS